MTTETQILLLVAGQIVTIIVLLVTNYINRLHTAKILKEKIQIEKQVDYLEKQLNEFYSPIYSLLKMNREIIKTRWDPETEKYTKKVPNQIWEDLRDNILIPNNMAIVDILRKKIHLIEGNRIPKCFSSFMVHSAVWPLTYKYGADFSQYLDSFAFPKEFSDLIYETTENLKNEYYELIKKA